MPRILVTGGAGFIGSHLCERLLIEGHQVVAIDDFSTGAPENLEHLRARGGDPKLAARLQLITHDVTEAFDFPVDVIFNLACPASPPHYQANPVKTTLTCVLGTLNGLRLAQRRGARFIQASTSEVYGDPEVHPQPESYLGAVNIVGPRACYDEGKRCAESLIMDFHRRWKLPIRIARIFNTYGPRMAFDDGRVVSNFILQALLGRDLTVYGDGSQTRSFCYVSDLIDGLMRLMMHPSEVRPVNLGNPAEFTVRALVDHVLLLTQSPSRVQQFPLPIDDPRQRRPDISRARDVLGFHPRIPLDLGLRRTIADFERRLKAQSGDTVESAH